MVEPPPPDSTNALNEKHPATHNDGESTNSGTPPATTVKSDDDSHALREKDFAYFPITDKNDHGGLFTTTNKAYSNSAFDLDLEAGQTPPNTTYNSHLQLPRTNTIHSNASSPADIGRRHSRRIHEQLDPGPPDIDLADGESAIDIGHVGIIENDHGADDEGGGRGRARQRRPRRVHHALGGVGARPGIRRRAHSLPTHTPVTNYARATGGGAPQPSMVKTLNTLLVPEKKLAPPPGWKDSVMNTITYSNMNWLLLFVPIAWGVKYGGGSDTFVFVFSFLAIIPLASLLAFATEELALKVGQTLGGLLNATFGNAVELIISILALVKGELRIVQAAMLGSILSNCLLVLGMCFLAGGFRFHEQGYGVRAAQLNISLLSISVFAIVIPAAFNESINFANPNSQATLTVAERNKTDRDVLAISRGTSIILLFVYAAYLVFQLWTHAYIYSAEASAYHSAQTHQDATADGPSAPHGQRVFRMPHLPSLPSLPSLITHQHTESSRRSHSRSSSSTSSSSSSSSSRSSSSTRSDGGEEEQKLKGLAALSLLAMVTVITGLTAEFLVGSINGLTATGKIGSEFVALILLPLVGNAAEHVTAVTVSVKNKLDLAITVAVGSSIQIALFVIPFLVLLGWIIGQPLSLFFDIYETVVVFVSILVVNYAISDGRTNWLEGLVLMIVYVLIALTTWYYPGQTSTFA